jgi:hypothetical protein
LPEGGASAPLGKKIGAIHRSATCSIYVGATVSENERVTRHG